MVESSLKGRKQCGKRRNCEQISPFPRVFSKTLSLVTQTRKNKGLFGEGLNLSKTPFATTHCTQVYSCTNKNFWTPQTEPFADDNLNIPHLITRISDFDVVENIVVQEENAIYQHFLYFPKCFHRLLSLGLLICGIV